MVAITAAQNPDTLLQQSASITATGVVGAPFVTDGYSALIVDVNVTAVAGTTPSMNIVVERRDAFGNYVALWTSPAITGVGLTSIIIGPFPTATGIQTGLLTDGARVRVSAISGAGATFTTQVSVIGR